MFLKRLSILNYKNLAEAQLDLSPALNCFIGQNGMGKTNVLESVYLCCTGRSHRTSHDKEMIRKGADFARVHVDA